MNKILLNHIVRCYLHYTLYQLRTYSFSFPGDDGTIKETLEYKEKVKYFSNTTFQQTPTLQ